MMNSYTFILYSNIPYTSRVETAVTITATTATKY